MAKKNTGGPAFPALAEGVDLGNGRRIPMQEGMSLRDYFASNAPTNEVQELTFHHLSRVAQERLTGLEYPKQPQHGAPSDEFIEFQIAEFKFKCAVNAAIRYTLSDAMLKARGSC